MNAPVSPSALAAAFEEIPLRLIAVSQTPAQIRRRARFTPESLSALAQNIQAIGVQQPITVRPHPNPEDGIEYELIFGERRFLGSQQAGKTTIPALVRDISDAELVELQLVENLQRQGLEPLDEAEAIRDMMTVQGIDEMAVAGRIGMARSTVYARLKLLKLQGAVMEALEQGVINHSVADEIARIPGKKLQLKALKLASTKKWNGEAMSVREVQDALRTKFMVRLDEVPFDLADETLKPGACLACPNFSRNDPELHADVVKIHGDIALLCTDKPCHDAKVIQIYDRRREFAAARQIRIIDGGEAKHLRPHRWGNAPIQGFIDLDRSCDAEIPEKVLTALGLQEGDGRANPTYRQLLMHAGASLDIDALFIDPHGKRPLDVQYEKRVAKALKKIGIKWDIDDEPQQAAPAERDSAKADAEREATRAQREKEEAKAKAEHTFRIALLTEIHKKFKGPLKRDDLEEIANVVWESAGVSQEIDELYDVELELDQFNERELMRFIVEVCILGPCLERTQASAEPLLRFAKRLRIDPAKVKKQLAAEVKKK